jgi:hypothetical protein
MATHISIKSGAVDMKTTIEISQPLFYQAKEIAAEHAITFKALVESGLHMVIKTFQASPPVYKYKNLSQGGDGMSRDFEKLSPLERRELANDRDA